MKELLIDFLQVFGRAWWAEIATNRPRCKYYFGPFLSRADVEAAKAGYIEDLEQEGAQIISISIKRCKPRELTVFDEQDELTGCAPILSSQA